VLLFHPGYIEQLLEIGYGDAQDKHDQLEAFLADTAAGEADPPGLRRCDGTVPSAGAASDQKEAAMENVVASSAPGSS
jgi:hypothetical protein